MATKRNDNIFQLSLTELAFTIIFILLLLLGFVVFQEQKARKELEQELANSQSAERAADALVQARERLREALFQAQASKPDEVISRLVASADVSGERDRYKAKLEDLDAKLTALEEIQKKVDSAAEASKLDVTKAEVLSSLALQSAVRKEIEAAEIGKPVGAKDKATVLQQTKDALALSQALRKEVEAQFGKEITAGDTQKSIAEFIQNAKRFAELVQGGVKPESIRKENADLRGQVAFLKHRLDARGGRDYPPCWADESGKVEFLFAIELKDDSVVVTPAWPSKREADARALPDIQRALEAPFAHSEFASRVLGVFGWSKKQNPECRHYVQLRSTISEAVRSDRARLVVENYFYKVEQRR